MGKEIVLKASKRKLIGKKVKNVRNEGKLPAVIYGKHKESTPILLNLHDAAKAIGNITPSTVVNLDIDGDISMSLVREIQRDFILGTYRHVDFQAISADELVRANVQVVIVGEAPAVKNFSGVLVQSLTTISVEALPKDLPDKYVIDISMLEEIGDTYSVGKMEVTEGVKVLNDPRASIVLVTGRAASLDLPEDEIEEGEEETEETLAEPEVIERGKKEEDEE
ncbi:MAG: 50S ribosomal protein L25 [Anaerolineaceae bacterium]|nr:50S ribosomal protein L25 [Anaerolineaceae bacterium]